MHKIEFGGIVYPYQKQMYTIRGIEVGRPPLAYNITVIGGKYMWKPPKYLVVETAVLPEVFTKVIYAKSLLESGEITNISQAAKLADISRSAIYKYRDSVFPYVNEMSSKVLSIYVLLRDKPGVLSGLISELYSHGVNILTINQNIPVDGMAAVSISVSLDATSTNDMEIINSIKRLEGVVESRKLTAR